MSKIKDIAEMDNSADCGSYTYTLSHPLYKFKISMKFHDDSCVLDWTNYSEKMFDGNCCSYRKNLSLFCGENMSGAFKFVSLCGEHGVISIDGVLLLENKDDVALIKLKYG